MLKPMNKLMTNLMDYLQRNNIELDETWLETTQDFYTRLLIHESIPNNGKEEVIQDFLLNG